MTETVRIFYKPGYLLARFAVSMVSLPLAILCREWEGTYTRFLDNAFGDFLLISCALYLTVSGLFLLPAIVRFFAGVPAVEFDGRHLTVRTIRTHRFLMSNEAPISVGESGSGNSVTIRASDGRSVRIALQQIDGPKSLSNLLMQLTSS